MGVSVIVDVVDGANLATPMVRRDSMIDTGLITEAS